MKGFNSFVCAALCAALVGVVSSYTDYGGENNKNGTNDKIITRDGENYSSAHIDIDVPELDLSDSENEES